MPAARPTPAFIRRAIEGVREAGERPAGVEVRPDGSVVVLLVANGALAALPSPPEAGEGLVDCAAIFAAGRGS